MRYSNLRIVVFPDTPKTWTARSLEHDLTAGGRSPEAALDTLVKMADAQIAYDIRHGHEPLAAFGAAPQMYWNAYGAAARTATSNELTHAEPQRSLRYMVGIVAAHPALRRMASLRTA